MHLDNHPQMGIVTIACSSLLLTQNEGLGINFTSFDKLTKTFDITEFEFVFQILKSEEFLIKQLRK